MFRVQGLGFRTQDLGCSGFKLSGAIKGPCDWGRFVGPMKLAL